MVFDFIMAVAAVGYYFVVIIAAVDYYFVVTVIAVVDADYVEHQPAA